jgi:thymidine kinase
LSIFVVAIGATDEIKVVRWKTFLTGVLVLPAGKTGAPFGPMPALMAIAEDVTKVHAICVRCGRLAYVSHRIVKDERQVLLGEKDEYEPLCRSCYEKARKESDK